MSQLTGERDCSGAAKEALAQAGGEEAQANRARQPVLSLELASCTMKALNEALLVSSTGVVKLEVAIYLYTHTHTHTHTFKCIYTYIHTRIVYWCC